MFVFHRHRAGPTEVYSILLPQGRSQDSERFGEPLRYSLYGQDRYHEVGMLVLIHGESDVEYLLVCKNGLTDEEQAILGRGIEHLVGKEVHTGGSEPTAGWYVYDSLRDPQLSPASTSKTKPAGKSRPTVARKRPRA